VQTLAAPRRVQEPRSGHRGYAAGLQGHVGESEGDHGCGEIWSWRSAGSQGVGRGTRHGGLAIPIAAAWGSGESRNPAQGIVACRQVPNSAEIRLAEESSGSPFDFIACPFTRYPRSVRCTSRGDIGSPHAESAAAPLRRLWRKAVASASQSRSIATVERGRDGDATIPSQ
jgi:hypothetical protein